MQTSRISVIFERSRWFNLSSTRTGRKYEYIRGLDRQTDGWTDERTNGRLFLANCVVPVLPGKLAVAVCLSICLSVYLSVCLSVCLFVCSSVSVCLSVCPPARPPTLLLHTHLFMYYYYFLRVQPRLGGREKSESCKFSRTRGIFHSWEWCFSLSFSFDYEINNISFFLLSLLKNILIY